MAEEFFGLAHAVQFKASMRDSAMSNGRVRAACRNHAAKVIAIGFAVVVTASIMLVNPDRAARNPCQWKQCGYEPEVDQVCGWCRHAEVCNHRGRCVAESCQKDCFGRFCGPDPICGFSCGNCGSNLSCSPAGECIQSSARNGRTDEMRSERVGRRTLSEAPSYRVPGDGRRGEP